MARLHEAHHHLTALRKYKIGDSHLQTMQMLEKNRHLTADKLCRLRFAIAKSLEDVGHLEESFNYYLSANDLRAQLLNMISTMIYVRLQK